MSASPAVAVAGPLFSMSIAGCSFVFVYEHVTVSPASGVTVAVRVSTSVVPLEQYRPMSL